MSYMSAYKMTLLFVSSNCTRIRTQRTLGTVRTHCSHHRVKPHNTADGDGEIAQCASTVPSVPCVLPRASSRKSPRKSVVLVGRLALQSVGRSRALSSTLY